jgi:hypothetical protein
LGHSVSDAAARSVKKSEITRLAERTPEQILADIRNNLASRLTVVPDDIRFLLKKYDDVSALLAQQTRILDNATTTVLTLSDENATLKQKNEEFREVYEKENSSQSITMERIPTGLPDSLESGSVESVPEQATEAIENVRVFESEVGFARMAGTGNGE